jgi:cytochrome c oxidase subunit II
MRGNSGFGMRRGLARLWSAAAALAAAAMMAPRALAAAGPHDWQVTMQPGVSPVREQIDRLHDDILLPIISVIALFVLGLLLYVIIRYSAHRHPTPSQTSHNAIIEVIWTTVPVLILLVIFIPSMRLLYYADHTQHADMTLKVTGHQWYWTYDYPDQGDFSFDSNLLVPEDKEPGPGQLRLLDVDKPVVVPVGATIRILVAGSEGAIHSWFVPAVGVQEYAVIGRNNESWMRIDEAGTYYGQCNQICGLRHPFMPIEIKAVSKDKFDQWTACQNKSDKEQPDKDACWQIAADDEPVRGAGPLRLATDSAR